VHQTKNTPKVGRITPACTEFASALYASCIDTIVPARVPAAELVKLLENTFRSVNIGMVNEMAIVCDSWASTYGKSLTRRRRPFVMKFTPGPESAGTAFRSIPLLREDADLNYKTRFIDPASEINSQDAGVRGRKSDGVNADRKPVNGSRILVLGVALRDIDDVRESPA
jgi:UDP-N-acetyl-D-glucosamine dehydrogenase